MPAELIARLGSFITILVGVAGLERRRPRRPYQQPRHVRFAINFGMAAIDIAVVRLFFPAAAVGFASFAQEYHLGLFNLWQAPAILATVLSIILLDLVIYAQHVVFHAYPLLWRLHMVHHTDLDFDVSTALRFHPVEILLSMLVKFAAIAILGAPPVAVLVFEILLNGTAMFNHGNLYLPPRVDRWLRFIVVTPDMHRVHHSQLKSETNRNFGFNLPWWDHLFGTYRDQPAAGHEQMVIGLEHYRDPAELTLGKLILLPLKGHAGTYPWWRKP